MLEDVKIGDCIQILIIDNEFVYAEVVDPNTDVPPNSFRGIFVQRHPHGLIELTCKVDGMKQKCVITKDGNCY